MAQQLGCDKTSVHNWEANASQPAIQYMPGIIDFLGYNPLPAKTLVERLVRGRTALGLTRGKFARHLGVDQSTLARWERGEREPTGALAARAERLIADTESIPVQVRRAG